MFQNSIVSHSRISVIGKVFTIMCLLCLTTAAAQEQWKSLFNGKNLDGWDGDPALWKVEDGQIVGTTAGVTLERNTFLIYTREKPGNFHLRAKLRMLGDSNSGIMYRAEPIEGAPHALKGAQMDIHPKLEYQGMYYSEQTGRGIVAQRGQRVTIEPTLNAKGKTTPEVKGTFDKEPSFDLSEWHVYEVIAVNKRLIHLIDGIVTVNVTDKDPQLPASGAIGFQLHRGPEMTIYVKDVELMKLSGEEAQATIKRVLNQDGSGRKQ